MDPTAPKPPQTPWVDNTPPPSSPSVPTLPSNAAPTPTPVGPPPPPFPTTPSTPPPTSTVITGNSGSGGKSRGFTFFIMISVLLLLGIWGYVGYLYYQNQGLGGSDTAAPENVQTPSPTPTIDPSEIQITNGDVSRVTPFGETQTLVKKDQYPGTGITGFVRVVVSPDISKLCFESIPPATTPALYVSNIDGSSVVEVAKDRNSCTWINETTIAYVNAAVGSPKVDIYRYDLNAKTEVNVTEATNTATEIRRYTIDELSGNILNCKYDVVNASGRMLSSSSCTVNTSTWEVSDATPTDEE